MTGGIPTDQDEWDKIPMGAEFGVEYSQRRHYKNHRRFFSFIKSTFDMQEHFDDRDVFRKWLTMKAGYFDAVVKPKNQTIFMPQSIAFEKMDADHRREYAATLGTVR